MAERTDGNERGIAAAVLRYPGPPVRYFRGGAAQLAGQAAHDADDPIVSVLAAISEQYDPAATVARFIELAEGVIADGGCVVGDRIAAAALDGAGPRAREVAAAAVRRWEALTAQSLRRHGVPSERAESAAALVVAAIEGAVLLSKAQGTGRPLRRVGRELAALLDRLMAAAVSSGTITPQ